VYGPPEAKVWSKPAAFKAAVKVLKEPLEAATSTMLPLVVEFEAGEVDGAIGLVSL
jgi:hypothetical protein